MTKRLYSTHKEKLRIYRERDRERHNAKRREWAKANPEKAREIARRWYEANKDRLTGGSKGSRKPRSAEARREYYRLKARRQYAAIKADPELWKESLARKQALRARRKLGAAGSYTAADIRNIANLQRGRCAICRQKLAKFHVDHILPLSKGGSNFRKNLQLLCAGCNQTKYDKDPLEHMRSLGRLL